VVPPGYGTYWNARLGDSWRTADFNGLQPSVTVDKYGNCYLAWQRAQNPGSNNPNPTFLYVQKRNNKGEEVWTKRYGSVPIFIPTQRVIPILDPTNTILFVGWGAKFRRPDPGISINTQPSLELFKINPSTGNLIWHYYYIFVPYNASYYNDAFTRIQYDSYSNKIVVFIRNFFLAQYFLVDPEDPSITTAGFSFYEGGTLESLRTIEDAMVIRPQENPENTFVVTVDNGNRYIWWETDSLFRGVTGASGLRYGPTTTFTYNNPIRALPTSVTFSGQEHFISANHELSIGYLVVWNKNRQPVQSTSTIGLGVPIGFIKDPADSSAVYVALTDTNAAIISGLSAKSTTETTFAVARYVPQTNRLTSFSYFSVVSGIGVNVNSDQGRATQFGCPENINNNLEYVNRAVFAMYNDDAAATSTAVIASGINSLFVMGVPVKASGTYKTLNWNNTAGFSGCFEATDAINKNMGSGPVPTLSTPFTNIGGSFNTYTKGSTYISGTVTDITGTITEAYGYNSFN
jgi:hypothetical protein